VTADPAGQELTIGERVDYTRARLPATPVKLGSTPAASIATLPRLACTVNRLKRGGGRVDPVQPPGHPGAGLVEVRHRRPGQPRAHDLGEPAQPSRTLGQHQQPSQ
jgi:hypothetical protein